MRTIFFSLAASSGFDKPSEDWISPYLRSFRNTDSVSAGSNGPRSLTMLCTGTRIARPKRSTSSALSPRVPLQGKVVPGLLPNLVRQLLVVDQPGHRQSAYHCG